MWTPPVSCCWCKQINALARFMRLDAVSDHGWESSPLCRVDEITADMVADEAATGKAEIWKHTDRFGRPVVLVSPRLVIHIEILWTCPSWTLGNACGQCMRECSSGG